MFEVVGLLITLIIQGKGLREKHRGCPFEYESFKEIKRGAGG